MAEFRRASHERVNVFEVEEVYLFRHFFDSDAAFDRLKPYYNSQQYRFEVPPGEFGKLRSFLAERGYGLVVVDAVEEFVVVVEQYTDHPDSVFEASVVQRTVDGYNCFLLKDREAVERTVEDGATRLTGTALENPF